MKIWQRIGVYVAVALLVVPAPQGALAASLSGRSSTVFEWFDDPQEDTALVGYEYLRLNISDIADGYRFAGYGRLAEDFADEFEIKNRLYYAYLEKTDLVPALDFRLGRQFISTSAGASVMDGLNLEYRDLGGFDVKLFGGGDVSYYEGYNADDLIVGGELEVSLADIADLGLSYLQKWQDQDLSHELIGFDANIRLADSFTLYNETQYSWLTDEVTYLLAGAKYSGHPRWGARLEYLYSLPVFSATSIYSVFAVAEYQEVSAELTYRIDRGLRVFGRYVREIYDEVDDAGVVELGLEKLCTARLAGYLVGTWRNDDDGQDLHGVKAYGSWRITETFDAGLGAHVDSLERRLEEDDETTSTRIWVDGTAYVTRTLNLQAKVEYVESDLWDEYYRGRVRLNVLF